MTLLVIGYLCFVGGFAAGSWWANTRRDREDAATAEAMAYVVEHRRAVERARIKSAEQIATRGGRKYDMSPVDMAQASVVLETIRTAGL